MPRSSSRSSGGSSRGCWPDGIVSHVAVVMFPQTDGTRVISPRPFRQKCWPHTCLGWALRFFFLCGPGRTLDGLFLSSRSSGSTRFCVTSDISEKTNRICTSPVSLHRVHRQGLTRDCHDCLAGCSKACGTLGAACAGTLVGVHVHGPVVVDDHLVFSRIMHIFLLR